VALALFDLDNTLLAGDSEHSWVEFLFEVGVVDEGWRAEGDRLYAEYVAGRLDIYESAKHQLVPLTRHPVEYLLRWRKEFMERRVEPMILPAALDLVEGHRAAGDEPVIITASNDFITRPIADRFGVENLLAVELERANGSFTGRVTGTPTFREGKISRLKEWLNGTGHTLEGSYFYSDSLNYLPLLELVENPVAVDPDPILRERAGAEGWPVLGLRDRS